MITGFDTKEEAFAICNRVSNILRSDCSELRKWCSNDNKIVKGFLNRNEESDVLILGPEEKTKTLDFLWSCDSDKLKFSHHGTAPKSKTIRKRIILYETLQIFDALGLSESVYYFS